MTKKNKIYLIVAVILGFLVFTNPSLVEFKEHKPLWTAETSKDGRIANFILFSRFVRFEKRVSTVWYYGTRKKESKWYEVKYLGVANNLFETSKQEIEND